MALDQVTIDISAKDLATQAFQKAQKSLASLSSDIDKYNKEAAIQRKPFAALSAGLTKLQSVGKAMTVGVTLPILAVGAAAIKVGGDYEATMNDLKVRSGSSTDDMKLLSAEARKFGLTTKFSASEAADGMIEFGKAGMKATDIISSTGAALNLAGSEGIAMGDAAGMISDTLHVFKKNASDAGYVADVLAKGAGMSTISIQQLDLSMKYAAQQAASLGIPLDDLVSTMATLGNQNIKGETAGTALRSFFTSLAGDKERQSKLISQGLKADGSDIFLDKKMTKMKPIIEVLEALKKLKLTKVQIAEDFGKEHGSIIEALINGTQELKLNMEEMGTKSGFAADTAAARMKGFNGSVTLLKNAVQDLFITMTEGSGGPLEILTGFVNNARDMVKWFNDLKPVQQSFLKWCIASATIIGPMAIAFAGVGAGILSISTSIAALSAAGIGIGALLLTASGVGLVIAGIVAGTFLLVTYWDDICSYMREVENIGIKVANKLLPKSMQISENLIGVDAVALRNETSDPHTAMSKANQNSFDPSAVSIGNKNDFAPSAAPSGQVETIKQSYNLNGTAKKDEIFMTIVGAPPNTSFKTAPSNDSNITIDTGKQMTGAGYDLLPSWLR